MNQKDFDIFLINPGAFTYFDKPYPPYQLLFLASALERAGYRVKILDFQVETLGSLLRAIKDSHPLWVGFTVMTGAPIKNGVMLAQEIKKYLPNTPLVWGGAHPTLLPEQTLGSELADIVVIGEGEETVVELSHAIREGKGLEGVRGIGLKDNGRRIINPSRPFIDDWDRQVILDWHHLDVEKYVRIRDGVRNMPFITSRGCPYRCAFCWNVKANRRQWRGWSIEGVIREVEKLQALNIHSITIMDDIVTLDMERLEKLAANLSAMNTRLAFDGGFRPDARLNEELFQVFKSAGCKHVNFGAESGSPLILKYIKKDLTVEDIIRSAELCKKYDIGATYNWMIGFPGETIDDIFESLNTIDRINAIIPNVSHVAAIYSPYPGSALYEETIKYGWKPPRAFEGWDKNREEMEYSYIKDIWYLRSVIFSSYFLYAFNTSSRDLKINNWFYTAVGAVLRRTAKLRWRYRYFGLPLEYKLLLLGVKFFKNLWLWRKSLLQ